MTNDNKLLKAYLLGYTTALEDLKKEFQQAEINLPKEVAEIINKKYANKATLLKSRSK